jgi:copper chaperone
MSTVIFDVPTISCNHCKHTIETELSELQGVQTVNADVAAQRVVVVFDPPADKEKIKDLLAEINYPATSESAPK